MIFQCEISNLPNPDILIFLPLLSCKIYPNRFYYFHQPWRKTMNTSIFIGRMLAVIYLTVGIGLLLNKEYYKKMMADFCDNRPLMYFGGISALTAGFLIITFHNYWEKDWTLAITLIGWIGLFKGIWILVFPEHVIKTTRVIMEKNQTAVFFALGFGLFFAYFSFLA